MKTAFFSDLHRLVLLWFVVLALSSCSCNITIVLHSANKNWCISSKDAFQRRERSVVVKQPETILSLMRNREKWQGNSSSLLSVWCTLWNSVVQLTVVFSLSLKNKVLSLSSFNLFVFAFSDRFLQLSWCAFSFWRQANDDFEPAKHNYYYSFFKCSALCC